MINGPPPRPPPGEIAAAKPPLRALDAPPGRWEPSSDSGIRCYFLMPGRNSFVIISAVGSTRGIWSYSR
jgi:hypothetical protein